LQLFGSVFSLTQPRTAPQYVSPEPAVQVHWKPLGPPAVHVEFGPQTVPQVPQLGLASFATHLLPHTIWPDGQLEQVPELHVSPVAHACPHDPQLLGSLEVLVQTPGLLAVMPQTTSVPGHAPQAPAAHGCPTAHSLPQAPQLLASVCSFTQAPAPLPLPPIVTMLPVQSVSPAGHVHAPPVHVAPVSHTNPQAPQLFGSDIVLTQPAAPHAVVPALHLQTPAVQVVLAGQTMPHPPQLRLSVCVLVHTPGFDPLAPHTVCPVAHAQTPA
jgi:hypothetical protein